MRASWTPPRHDSRSGLNGGTADVLTVEVGGQDFVRFPRHSGKEEALKLWFFERNGKILDLYDTPLTAVIRSATQYSAQKVFEKEYPGESADSYAVTELKQTGRSGVICCDIHEA